MRIAPSSMLCLAVTLATAGLAVEASAQGSKWWQSERFQKELALSADQIGRLEAEFQTNEAVLRAQKAALDKCEEKLSQVVSDPKSTEQHVVQAVTRVDAARAGLGQTRTLMLFRMRRILTDEQNAKMKVLHARDRAHRTGRDQASHDEASAHR